MPGTVIPAMVRQAAEAEPVVQVNQAVVTALPSFLVEDLSSLQETDPDILRVLAIWEQGSFPSFVERQKLSKSVLTLLRQ